jgi:hypothetical protein
MDTESEKGSGGAAGGEGEEERKADEKETGARYTGPERRAQGYLIAEVVEEPAPDAPTRPSDFPA